MSDRLSTLDDIQTAIWSELSRAADTLDHDWRTPVLATVAIDADGHATADARTVVLRATDVEARQLLIYSDSRAQKVGQLKTQPEATLVFWSRSLGWQLRCRLRCEVAENGLAVSSHWARIKLTRGAQDYLSPLAPGKPIGEEPPPLDRREHFAMLSAQVLAVDWLELSGDGHRRALFADGAANWLQP